jgi:hypothetical protein
MTSSTVSSESAPRSSMKDAFSRDLVFFHAQVLDHDLLHALCDVAHSVVPRLLSRVAIYGHAGLIFRLSGR